MAKAENIFVTFSVTTFLPMGYYLDVLSLYLSVAQKTPVGFLYKDCRKSNSDIYEAASCVGRVCVRICMMYVCASGECVCELQYLLSFTDVQG